MLKWIATLVLVGGLPVLFMAAVFGIIGVQAGNKPWLTRLAELVCGLVLFCAGLTLYNLHFGQLSSIFEIGAAAIAFVALAAVAAILFLF